MKRLMSAALFAAAVAFSCVSTPVAPVQQPEPQQPAEPDILELIAKGDAQGIQALFKGKELADRAGPDGRYPLHVAAAQGSADMVNLLLAMGASPDPRDSEGRTPLRYAIDAGNPAMAKALINRGASLFTADSGGRTALDALIAKGMGAAVLDRNSVTARGPARETPLHVAVERVSLEATRAILALDPDLNAKDSSGRTPLDAAYARPNDPASAALAELLIGKGATSAIEDFSYFNRAVRDTNYARARFADGATVLHEAVRFDHRGYLSFFLDRGVPVDVKNASGSTPLHDAVRSGRMEAVRILLAKGADPNAIDGSGNAPLHLALSGPGATALMDMLLSSGANPEIKDRNGNSALHTAVDLGYPPVAIGALIARGAPLDSANAAGETALFIAVRRRSADLVPELVGKGASVFVRNGKGESPLSIALLDGPQSASLLLSRAARDIKDDSGESPFHHAVRLNAAADAIAAIGALGYDPSARNAEGDGALHLAVRSNRPVPGEALLLAGAQPFAVNARGQSPLVLALSAADGIRGWFFTAAVLGARDALGNGPLHYAAAAGLQSGIRFLAQRGAPVSEANKDGRSPAMLTLQGDSTAALEELIRLGANLKQRDSSGASALHLSVLWNARACMALLAELGTGIDPRDFTGKTPLRLAVDRKDISGVGFLLSKGANPLARDNIGETPLHIAARLGETASLKQLMEKVREGGMDERDDAGTTALLEAVYAGSLESAALLAQAGASIHAKDSSGESPLSQAARNGQASLRAVLNRGNIFHSDSDGRSVLRVLLDVRADAELFQAALSLGTLLDGRDAAGRTPLMLALSLNRLEVVALLANAGADPFARDADGSTPMGLALSAGDDALRALFEKQPNRADELGDSALHYAAALGGEAGAALLLSLGADPTVRNASGETPADVAKRRGHGSLAELLAPNR